ncbi:fluoride efflux transporter CrcB [Neobacillus niacini]|uniref:fluoride efflux transporter CrcB n=1 Tax=Neobacillus niacini TaxID=86668 RepID=UPI0021CB839B|nr:fluoride efflux transporter CrcB [Neobacillus niacini]MCM3764518.1 fluoride efflux transporter CrcB [Neobacillus niacini]
MIYIYVGIAGFFGALLRYLIGLGLAGENSVFPVATLTINLAGSFLLAWLTTVVLKKISLPDLIKTAIATGFVGSFTTFSTFSVETVELFREDQLFFAFAYVLLSFFGGLAMSRLGFRVRKGGASE